MSSNHNLKFLGIAIGVIMLPAFSSPFYAKEIQKKNIQDKNSPSTSYWLLSAVPDEGLCGNKMRPNLPVITRDAENGNEFAAFRLGQLYRAGSWGITQDMNKARYWFERAAKGGQRSAQIIMGQAYEFGRLNLQHDAQRAIAYYKLAIKLKFEPTINDRIVQLQRTMQAP
ncbi:MAG: tetratricopeptide repeat protein [Anaerolineales bacterium]